MEQDKKDIINTLKNKITGIISLYESCKHDANQLKIEKKKLEEENNKLKEKYLNLENKYDTLKLAKSISGNNLDSTMDAKSKINNIVREIDKCIALLNR